MQHYMETMFREATNCSTQICSMFRATQQICRRFNFKSLSRVHRCLATAASSGIGSDGASFYVPAEAADRLLVGPMSQFAPGECTVSLADLGLAQTWWPSDWALTIMDLLHTDACLPWWASALVMGAAVRAVAIHSGLTFFRFNQQLQLQRGQQDNQSAGRIASLTAQLRAAQAANNVAESHRLARKLRATATLSEAARESAPPGAMSNLALGVGSQAVWLLLHISCLRAMSVAAAVPVPGIQCGGPTDWLMDLTCADPSGAAALVISLMLLANVRLDAATSSIINNSSKAQTPSANNSDISGFGSVLESARPVIATLGPVVFFTFLLNCPSILLFYFGATGFVALATNMGLYLTASRIKSSSTSSVSGSKA